MTRRGFIGAVAVLLAVGLLMILPGDGFAQEKVVKIGMSLPLTGADADAPRASRTAPMAIEENDARRRRRLQAGGHRLDSGTSTAGQYDPAQAATNAKKFVADPSVVAIVGARDERRGQGDDADPVGRQSGDDHAFLDQPRHHRSEVRGPVQAERQGDLFPHGHDGRLSGPEHGQLHARHPEGEVGLYPR